MRLASIGGVEVATNVLWSEAALRFECMNEDTALAFGGTVESVDVVENGLRMLCGGEPLSERSYLQAVVFRLDDGRLVSLDKRTWFGETLAVGVVRRLEDVVRDESADWEDDPEEMPLMTLGGARPRRRRPACPQVHTQRATCCSAPRMPIVWARSCVTGDKCPPLGLA